MKDFLIIYDIRHPKRLIKIARLMNDFGVRVQKSVFEAKLNNQLLNQLRARAKKVMEDMDSLIAIELCQRDWQKRKKFGPGDFAEVSDKPFEIID